MTERLTEARLPEAPLCSVGIKCADDHLIKRCLDSIDDPTVTINAAITPSPRVEQLLDERGIPYVVTPYGNTAKTAQLAVDTAERDHVIVMDSDCYFAPGAISALREGFTEAPVVKPQLKFFSDSYLSGLTARNRQRYYDYPGRAIGAGMGVCRSEVTERCGYVFDPSIRWGEHMDLDYRMKANDVPLAYAADGVIYHDPIPLGHDMRCAFLHGVRRQLSAEHDSAENIDEVLRKLVEPETWQMVRENLQERGVDGALYAAAYRTVRFVGYNAQKYLGKWATQA